MADTQVQEPAAAIPATPAAPVTSPQPSPDSGQQVQQPQQPQQFDLLSFAQQRGFDTAGCEKPDDFAAKLLDEYQRAQAVAAWAQQNVQQKPEPPPAASAPPKEEEWSLDGHLKKHWGLPQFDPAWQEAIASGVIVKDPETGQYVPRPGMNSWMTVNPVMLQQVNSWQQGYEKNVRDFLQDPYRKIIDVVQDVFDRRYAKPEVLDERLQQQRTTDYLAATEERLAPFLYADPANVPDYRDPRFAQNLTEYGKTFYRVFDDFASVNPNAPTELLIQKTLQYAPMPQSPAQPQTPAAPATAPSPPVPPAQQDTSFLGDALARAANQASGVTPPTPQSAGPRVMNSNDLKNLIRAA
jgi:hypothetical protein